LIGKGGFGCLSTLELLNHLRNPIIKIQIKSRISREKAAFAKAKTFYTSKLDTDLRKKLVNCCGPG
jgi:hypothetical protein